MDTHWVAKSKDSGRTIRMISFLLSTCAPFQVQQLQEQQVDSAMICLSALLELWIRRTHTMFATLTL